MFKRLVLLVAPVTVFLVARPCWAADPVDKTGQLVAALRSDAPLFEKARACQQLGETGSAEAVPALAALLGDQHLNAYARSGLQGIGGPSAAAALREAAGRLKEPLLAGVVNSLGALRDEGAVPLLSRLAADPASGCVREALLALGNIATTDCLVFLERMLGSGPAAGREPAAESCLLAADRQRLTGNNTQARELYDLIRTSKTSIACRVGATRGAILARAIDRAPFLMEQLRSREPAIRNAALLTVREIPDDALATALNGEVLRAGPEMQGQILLALADCHNAQSFSAVERLGGSPDAQIRKTALLVLGRMGPQAAPLLLAALQKEPPAEERTVVLSGLRTMEGPDVDDLLLRALSTTGSASVRIELIRLLDSRGVQKAAPQLVRLAGSPDKSVGIAAFSALKSLANQTELPALMALARSCADLELREAAENALAGLCGRSGETASEVVLRELKQSTKSADRTLWMNVLARVGYAKALPLLEAAAQDADPAVANDVLAQLGRWPDPAPMEALLRTMETAPTPGLRKIARSSALNLAGAAADDSKYSAPMIVRWLERANGGGPSVPDQRRILGVLGRLKTIESFRLACSYLDNPELATEAAADVVQLAPVLAKGPAVVELKLALDKIESAVTNADLRQQAGQISRKLPVNPRAVSLFDGSSLAGWEGDTNVWRVREGLIVGGSLKGNPRNEFLATTRSYTNFFLRLEYKLVGTEGFVNSGVQFRSVRVSNPPNEMNGYQADIGAGHSGCLYDESRRNSFLARASYATIRRLEKVGDWNLYELRCEGPHIQVWLNGEKTVDYTEPNSNIPQTGLIGLQIHGGNKAEVSFRNITLQEL